MWIIAYRPLFYLMITTIKFSDFWEQNFKNFDIVFCLGDRFEMFAAVMAGLVYGVPFAHIHGGEFTLGAIDNVFRNSITMASQLHFVAAKYFAERVGSLLYPKNVDENIVVCGALSLDNLQNIELLTKTAFFEKWSIDLNVPSILITIHPETIDSHNNEKHLIEVSKVLNALKDDYQLIITMPNADTLGSIYRTAFIKFSNAYPEKVKLIENFGTQSYFTCMQYVDFLLGNTSSGIIEAASFNKFVINIGTRQKGRLSGDNVLHVPIEYEAIISKVNEIESKPSLQQPNIYYNGGAVKRIVEKLKQYNNTSSDKN
jgi:GDP/UDP-N,N'-diacetylbacillosamine 2-epimerase (hydrolysing)